VECLVSKFGIYFYSCNKLSLKIGYLLYYSSLQYGISILYINVYTYISILILFFNLLFLFDVSKLKSINNIKILNKVNFISITISLTFLSMSGIPPLAGFVGKFLIFNFLFFLQKYIYILVFSLLNFFSIYFYIQNLRFLIIKSQTKNNFLKNNFIVEFSKNLLNIIVFLNFLNFFGIIYFEDILYIFLNLLIYTDI